MRILGFKGIFGLTAYALVAISIAGCTTNTSPSSVLQSQLEMRVREAVEIDNIAPGFAIAVIGPTEAQSYSAAAGVADTNERPFTPDTPLRIASNTKTFTAATVLRLWEDGLLDLDAPITALIDPEFDVMLQNDGYDTTAITVRHLLMHTAGLPDHADDSYVDLVMADPSRQWTRRDQLAVAVDAHDPLGPPNNQFSYSDTGYILLGHIVERLTGETLAAIVRRELKFSEIGLEATWWEQVEQPPAQSAPRARQYVSGVDATDWNGSIDLYGGGGLVMSPNDLARFMTALMRNEIFDDPATLETMLSAPGHPFPDKYRIGLFPRTIEEFEAYSHEGFWGTHVIYIPELDAAVSAVVLDQSGYREMFPLVSETIRDIANSQ
ncbi:MAG: serine hydrolase domain-containing protein [Pseudomonadota bacterium]